MRSMSLFGAMGMAVLLMGTSCSHDPEDFCASWVENTCQALTGCCQSGATMDAEECRLQLSQTCLHATQPDQVQAGVLKFDSGAASTCLGAVSTCADFRTATEDSYAHQQACANMVTGHHPMGAACTASSDCEAKGDFATCYSGGPNGGFCAQVVPDEESCSFSFDTGELHVCPDGKYCDRSSFKPNVADPPSKRIYEFTATCKADVTAGGDCFDGSESLPCAKGLYCDVNGSAMAKCAARKSAGAGCQFGGECAEGLDCTWNAQNTGQTCEPAGASLGFCFTPTKCGDGICESPETLQTCPSDCGGGTCGDGVCSLGENVTCPQDCP